MNEIKTVSMVHFYNYLVEKLLKYKCEMYYCHKYMNCQLKCCYFILYNQTNLC